MTVLILPSRHGDFFLQQGRKEVVCIEPTANTQTLLHEALSGIKDIYTKDVPYKKAGIVVSGLIPESQKTDSLFALKDAQASSITIDSITDILNLKFGHGTVRSGIIQKNGARGSAKLRSKEYTTNWRDIPTVQAK